MNYRSPLRRARGLGSSKTGFHHWWMQRLTAIVLIPLTVWFVFASISLAGQDRAHVLAYLQLPHYTILLSLFLVIGLYHGMLGLTTIIEDYIVPRWMQLTGRIGAAFAALLMGVTGVFALLRLVFGG